MNIPPFVLALLPKNKILSYIISAIIGAAAMFAGVNATDLKDAVCKREPVKFESAEKIDDAKLPK